MSKSGWQPDGSYIPCPECGAAPVTEHEAGADVPAVTHRIDCSRLPGPTADGAATRRADAEAVDRVRRAGEAEARLSALRGGGAI
jgi:hypothetical protein